MARPCRHGGWIGALTLLLATPANAAAPIAGSWLTDNGEALVRVAPCGRAMCGRIARVLKPRSGAHATDDANPDPRLRGQPVQGMAILIDLTDTGSVWKGRIYNPETGKSYAAKVRRTPEGMLKVEGCVAFLCKGPTWRPAR